MPSRRNKESGKFDVKVKFGDKEVKPSKPSKKPTKPTKPSEGKSEKVKVKKVKVKVDYKKYSDSEAVAGYGMPTVGSYDPYMGGYKAFGTVGQGEEMAGARDANDTKCEDRKLIVTVTAVPFNQTDYDIYDDEEAVANATARLLKATYPSV